MLATGAALAKDEPFIVIDRASGEVLIENRPFERWYPASLTKLMTLYVTMRAIAAGEIAPGSPVPISKLAASQPPTKLAAPAGSVLRVDAAMRVVVVKSANDVAIALAEAVAGSVPAFVERMNGEAERLGLADSRFANPNGLHSDKQYSSARDLAFLARQILTEFPQYRDYFAEPAMTYGGRTDHSYNLLLERFTGADGMKTGFVCASGYNFIASATRNGRQLIAVSLGMFSQSDRAIEGARLLLEGFERDAGPPIEGYRRAGAPSGPKSQRAAMCSESATKRRYDPAPGDAVIKSALLEPRRVVRPPLDIRLGGVDAPPSEAALTASLAPTGRIPVPERRPAYTPVPVASQATPEIAAEPARPAGSIPIPEPRPDR